MTEAQDGSDLCFPRLLNASCRKPAVPRSEAAFLHLLLSSVSALTVILNLLVIISVSHFRQLHRPTNLLLLSLAVSDFVVGLVFMPGEILRKTSCWFLGDLVCSLYKYFAAVSVCGSIGNMVLISADRYVAICDPLRYPTTVTVGKAKLCIFLCWLCSILYSSMFVKDESWNNQTHVSCRGKCVFHTDAIRGAVNVFVTFILPVSVIVFLYIRVFAVAVSQARAVRSHLTAVSLQPPQTVTSRKSELKAARTLGIVISVFLICFCPIYFVALSPSNLLKTSYGIFVLCLFCFNPCLNPVIYALFYPWFRRAIKLIVGLHILQPGSREATVM